MFFSFDGIDGAGKSTQMDLFCDWLINDQRHSVIRCREPGGTEFGEKLRTILLGKSSLEFDILAEMFLFMASRAELVRQVIRPAIADGKTVVCDRFLLASIVYQGHAGGLDPAMIRQVGNIATNELCPDLTFCFHLDPEIAATRVGDDTDRIESRSDDFLTRVNDGFIAEASKTPEGLLLIDGAESIDSIHQKIILAASSIIPS